MWAFFVSEIFYFQEPVTCGRPDAADDGAVKIYAQNCLQAPAE